MSRKIYDPSAVALDYWPTPAEPRAAAQRKLAAASDRRFAASR